VETRICTSCEESKPITEFQLAKRYRGGRLPRCRLCVKKYPANRKTAIEASTRERRKRNHEFLLDYLRVHPCVDCGESDPLVLEFDHVRGEKLKDVSRLAHDTHALVVIEEEIAKCEVVCANCHKRRTAAQQGWHKLVSNE